MLAYLEERRGQAVLIWDMVNEIAADAGLPSRQELHEAKCEMLHRLGVLLALRKIKRSGRKAVKLPVVLTAAHESLCNDLPRPSL